MSVMLDIVASMVIAGVILLSIFSLTGRLNQELYSKTFDLSVQSNMVELSRIMESDIVKIGYHDTLASSPITSLGSNGIAFRADLNNLGSGHMDVVSYAVGLPTDGSVSSTPNPNDRLLYRTVNGVQTRLRLGVTDFTFVYYDSANVVTANPALVRSIRLKVKLESPEPVDGSYAGVFWDKRIYPRNLQ